MTADDWKKLTRNLSLPPQARKAVEAELEKYSLGASATAQTPGVTRKKLKDAAALASKLLRSIGGFGPHEHAALVEDVGKTPRLDAHKILEEQILRVTALRDRLTLSASKVEKGGKSAVNQRSFIKRINQVVIAHTGQSLSKGKRELDFVYQLGRLATPVIGLGSMREAIQELEPTSLARKRCNSS